MIASRVLHIKPLKINTTTVLVSTPVTRVCVADLASGEGVAKCFPNSVSIIKRNAHSKKITTKVFSNGKLHMTGACSVEEAQAVAIDLVTNRLGVAECTASDLDVNVHMVNASFKVARSFLMEETCNVLVEGQQADGRIKSVTYEKSHHPAINIRLADKKGTILLFRTGSVIITCPGNVFDVYKMCLDLIEGLKKNTFHAATCRASGGRQEPPKKRGRKRKCESEAFYNDLSLIL